MTFLLHITVAFMLYARAETLNCPSGWMAHGQSCYHFSHDKEEWISARLVCQSYAGYLAEIGSSAEENFLKTEVNRLGGNFWLGGNDLVEEGVWRWAMSGALVAAYTHWGTHEPNNLGSNENCMRMNSAYDGWVDDVCMKGWNYVCEMEPGSENGASIVG